VRRYNVIGKPLGLGMCQHTVFALSHHASAATATTPRPPRYRPRFAVLIIVIIIICAIIIAIIIIIGRPANTGTCSSLLVLLAQIGRSLHLLARIRQICVV
jgi:hypothetical protein